MWHRGYLALRHVGPSRTRDQTSIPCVISQILNCWITREVPVDFLMMVILISVRLILQRGFDLHFSNNYMLSIFSCDCWLSVCLLWRNTKNILLWRILFRSSADFFGWVVWLVFPVLGCLYILETKPLSFALFINTFSQSLGYLSVLLINVNHYYYKFNFLKGRGHILYFSLFLATDKHTGNSSTHFFFNHPVYFLRT